jgi:predicted membrane protein
MQHTLRNRTLGLGLLIIIIGLGFLLRQFNLFDPYTEDILFSWQMLLIVIGVYNLFFADGKTTGFILIIIGGFFLLPEVFELPYNFRRTFWPVLLILLGFFILSRSGLFGRRRHEPMAGATGEDINFIEEVNIFGGSEKKFSGIKFRGGKITSIFGGSDVDLSDAEMDADSVVVEVFYLFGGSSLTVPRDWHVINQVTTVLGGFSDKRPTDPGQRGQPQKSLILRGLVIFGGGEIKSR